MAVQRPIPGPGAFSGHRVIQADRGQLTLSGPGITVVKVIDADALLLDSTSRSSSLCSSCPQTAALARQA